MKSIYNREYRRMIQKLVERRKELKLTQNDLAKALSVPQPLISKIEHFVRRIDLIETKRICEELHISIKDLLE